MRRDKVKVFRVSRGAFLSIFRAGIPSGRMGLRDFPPLPAPGCRGYDHGKVRGIGSNGFNWLSAIPQENATARNLHFNTEGGQSESSN